MKKYRKKPMVIEAVQLTVSNGAEVALWCGGALSFEEKPSDPTDVFVHMTIPTLEGNISVFKDDWIYKNIKGEFCPMKPDIFEELYELAEEGINAINSD